MDMKSTMEDRVSKAKAEKEPCKRVPKLGVFRVQAG